jgi:DNA-binding transcriptional LysR family regulator
MEKEFQRLGIAPDIVCETQSVMSACQLVASGIGMTPVDPLLLSAIGLTGVTPVAWDIPIDLEYCFFRPISGASSPLIQKFSSALRAVVNEICDGPTGRFIKRLPPGSVKQEPRRRA